MGASSGSRKPSQSALSRPVGFDPERVEWRTQTARYANGKDFLVAGLPVGSVFYDGVSSRTVTSRYKVETRLPGLKVPVDRFDTEERAKSYLERFVLAWFARTLPAIATETRRAETTGSVEDGGAAIAQKGEQ